jgi:hypothetical protein
VFDTGYGQIASILGKSETSCRQIVSRARRRVRAGRPRLRVSVPEQENLLGERVRAVHVGDQAAILQLFAEDAKWTADGGGNAFAARKVVHGSDRIARFLLGLFRKLRSPELLPIIVNEEPGLALLAEGRLLAIHSVRADGSVIQDVFSVVNPEKLRGVSLATQHWARELSQLEKHDHDESRPRAGQARCRVSGASSTGELRTQGQDPPRGDRSISLERRARPSESSFGSASRHV